MGRILDFKGGVGICVYYAAADTHVSVLLIKKREGSDARHINVRNVEVIYVISTAHYAEVNELGVFLAAWTEIDVLEGDVLYFNARLRVCPAVGGGGENRLTFAACKDTREVRVAECRLGINSPYGVARVNISDGYIVGFANLAWANCRIGVIADDYKSVALEAVVCGGADLLGVAYILYGDIVDFRAVVVTERNEGVSDCGAADVSDCYVVDIPACALNVGGIVDIEADPSVGIYGGEGYHIVARLTIDILDYDIVATVAEVDAVLVAPILAGAEEHVADNALRAELEAHTPIPLVGDADILYSEALDVDKEYGSVEPYGNAPFILGILAKACGVAAVEGCRTLALYCYIVHSLL